MNLMELVIAGIMFVVLGFTLSIGQQIQNTNAQTLCTSTLGYSWGNYYNSTNTTLGGTGTNPLDRTTIGCCSTVLNATTTATVTNYTCKVWVTNNYALNASYDAMSAQDTLASWLPIIALAMAAGFVIAILITYLLGAVVRKSNATI